MNPNDAKEVDVLIWVVSNGYRVNPGGRYTLNNDSITSKSGECVFESFDALVQHLRAVLPVHKPNMTSMTFTMPEPKRKR